MKLSFRVGRLFGIELRIHVLFLALVVFIGVADLIGGGSIVTAVRAASLVVTVFAIVVIHELAHATVARRFGVATRGITLYPFGGVAELDRLPEDPKQEILVAVAGPLVNVALAALLFAGHAIAGKSVLIIPPAPMPFLTEVFWANVSLSAFNLIPAFPMDGGRVLRAVIATRTDRVRATRIAAKVGTTFAIAFAILGLLFQPMLVAIAAFIWFAGRAEASDLELRLILTRTPVRAAMAPLMDAIAETASIDAAIAKMHATGAFALFLLDEAGRPVGTIDRDGLLRAMVDEGGDVGVGRVASRDLVTLSPDLSLADAVKLFTQRNVSAATVVEDGRVVGALTTSRIAELVALTSAVERARERRERLRLAPSPHLR